MPNCPTWRQQGTATQLIVKDKPFLIIGGQVHNSASGGSAYFERVVTKLTQLHANTVFAPVTWELLEPTEGNFDFTQLEDTIRTARKHQMKLVVPHFIWQFTRICPHHRLARSR